ncbi:ImuA family protein [soil metagenome]
MIESASQIIKQLQKDILPLQGYRPLSSGAVNGIGFPPLEKAFPNNTFPTGAIHEFLSDSKEALAVTNGFVSALLSRLIQNKGACLWISPERMVFPPGLKTFGIEPHKIIFITIKQEKEQLWAMEEALKCNSIAAVVGQIKNIDFTASRRFQLSVEQTNVTGFVIRQQLRTVNTIAAVARWKITPLHSTLEDDMPGVGYPAWNVELQKVRNGKPGNWQVQWLQNRLQTIHQNVYTLPAEQLRRIG